MLVSKTWVCSVLSLKRSIFNKILSRLIKYAVELNIFQEQYIEMQMQYVGETK